MSNSTHVIIPDSHAHPSHHNKRYEWLGKLIYDIKPDVVIDIGDFSDVPSLCSYDKGKGSFQDRRYQDDVNCTVDAQEKLWYPYRRGKKRLPRRVKLIGNHEYRVERAIESNKVLLDGTISMKDFQFDRYWDDVVEYDGETPGIIFIDGVAYAHYFTSGVSGRPIGGDNVAAALLGKKFHSCTQGHSHLTDLAYRSDIKGKRMMGLICGCLVDFRQSFAGQSNDDWVKGVWIKHNVSGGVYDPEFISLERLKREYGGR
jgi:hypothetical protein